MLGTTRQRWDKYLWKSYNEAVSVTNMSASIRGHCGRLLGLAWLQMCFLWLLPCFKFWINCQKSKNWEVSHKSPDFQLPGKSGNPRSEGFFSIVGENVLARAERSSCLRRRAKTLPFVTSKSTVWQHLVPRPLPSSMVLVQCLDVLESPSLVAINFLVCSHAQGGSTVSYWCSIGKWARASM